MDVFVIVGKVIKIIKLFINLKFIWFKNIMKILIKVIIFLVFISILFCKGEWNFIY